MHDSSSSALHTWMIVFNQVWGKHMLKAGTMMDRNSKHFWWKMRVSMTNVRNKWGHWDTERVKWWMWMSLGSYLNKEIKISTGLYLITVTEYMDTCCLLVVSGGIQGEYRLNIPIASFCSNLGNCGSGKRFFFNFSFSFFSPGSSVGFSTRPIQI